MGIVVVARAPRNSLVYKSRVLYLVEGGLLLIVYSFVEDFCLSRTTP